MRVISGEFRGRKLSAMPGNQTRPTADKVKESMFNMLGPYFDGGRALDLFAGTGALGIEAVSRGMAHAVEVDRQFAAIQTIRANIALTKQPARFTVIKASVQKALVSLAEADEQFNLVMADPPYAKQDVLGLLAELRERQILASGAYVMLETGLDVDYPAEIPGYTLLRRQTYGVAQVLIVSPEEGGQSV